jgi:hypothetical protein
MNQLLDGSPLVAGFQSHRGDRDVPVVGREMQTASIPLDARSCLKSANIRQSFVPYFLSTESLARCRRLPKTSQTATTWASSCCRNVARL